MTKIFIFCSTPILANVKCRFASSINYIWNSAFLFVQPSHGWCGV